MRGALLFILTALLPLGAYGQNCVPSGARQGTIGCFPAISAPMTASDYLAGWQPSLGAAGGSVKITPSQILQASLPGTFGLTSVTDTTDSTSTTNGSLTVLGGLGVAKSLFAKSATITNAVLGSNIAGTKPTTLSGSTVNTPMGLFNGTIGGTSTIANDTSLATARIEAASYTAQIPNGTYNLGFIAANLDAGWTGYVRGLAWLIQTRANTTLAARSNGALGVGGRVIVANNMGGTSSGFGTTQFGYGSFFGFNPRIDIAPGGTYLYSAIGGEIGGQIQSGGSAGQFSLLQLVLEGQHAVHGTIRDSGYVLSAQTGAAVGLRNGWQLGTRSSQWPISDDGYIFQAWRGNNDLSVPAVAAGGFDTLQVDYTGTGAWGSGFAWRSKGMQILADGQIQTGYGLIDGASGGLSIDVPFLALSGTPTIATGGTNWTSGFLAGDAHGDIVQVGTTGGVVTSISSVVRRARVTSAPSNPVTFNAINQDGTLGFGSGLTLNLSFAGNTTISIGATNATAINIGRSAAITTITGTVIMPTTATPASASDTCTTGTRTWDADYVYQCVATDTWKRAAISTW